MVLPASATGLAYDGTKFFHRQFIKIAKMSISESSFSTASKHNLAGTSKHFNIFQTLLEHTIVLATCPEFHTFFAFKIFSKIRHLSAYSKNLRNLICCILQKLPVTSSIFKNPWITEIQPIFKFLENVRNICRHFANAG